MSNLVCHNSVANDFVLESLNHWVEKYLLAHKLHKVRAWAMMLLVSLVPGHAFKHYARALQADAINGSTQVKSQVSISGSIVSAGSTSQ